jgi:hypothetical protein
MTSERPAGHRQASRSRFHVGNSLLRRRAGVHLLANTMSLTQNLSLG